MTRPKRDPRDTLAGTFLILCGLGFTLAGGGCTVGWVSFLYPILGPDSGVLGSDSGFVLMTGLFWLLVSIMCAGVGVLAIQHGLRRLRGGAKEDADEP